MEKIYCKSCNQKTVNVSLFISSWNETVIAAKYDAADIPTIINANGETTPLEAPVITPAQVPEACPMPISYGTQINIHPCEVCGYVFSFNDAMELVNEFVKGNKPCK